MMMMKDKKKKEERKKKRALTIDDSGTTDLATPLKMNLNELALQVRKKSDMSNIAKLEVRKGGKKAKAKAKAKADKEKKKREHSWQHDIDSNCVDPIWRGSPHLQSVKSYHFWLSWHYQRPQEWDYQENDQDQIFLILVRLGNMMSTIH